IRIEVDVIVAQTTPIARVAQQASTTIPIIVAVMSDPVRDGLVASLARPGGNITGLTFLGPELVPKRLAFLKEALPSVVRVATLWHPNAYGERTTSAMMKGAEAAAETLGIRLRLVGVQSPDEIDGAFSMMAEERSEALMIFPSPMLYAERRRIIELAT